MYNGMYRIICNLIDYMFPSYCVNCGVNTGYEDAFICNGCMNKIEYPENKCRVCSGKTYEEGCTICSGRKFYIEKNIIISNYSGVMKEILHNYKFNKKRRLYKVLSGLAFREISELKDCIDIVSAVPINRKKRWGRGYNQSELLARDIARKINKKYRTLLKEKYNFKTQKKLGYRDRFLNILGRYKAVNTRILKGKRLLIIDDVITTGATINECARVLLSSGALKVYSLTMARANIKRLDKFSFSE